MALVRDSLLQLGVPAGQIAFSNKMEALHSFLVVANKDCLLPNDTFINGCGFDMAGAILEQLQLTPAPRGTAVPENLIDFEQSLYFARPDGDSMSDTAFVYVPTACRLGARPCRLHIALHGCQQGHDLIGEAFVSGAGYNAWAEANGIVVLYPQANRRILPRRFNLSDYNPFGCWDWWGYSTGSTAMLPNLDYLGKDAPQMATIAAMAAALGAPLDQGGTP